MDGPERRRRLLVAGGLSAVASAALLVALLSSGGGSRRAPARPGASGTPGTSAPTGAAPAPVGPPAQSAPPSEQFGANVNRLFNDRTYSPAQIDAQLEALHQTGATIARSDALWEAAEPAPPTHGVHRYDWGFDDLIAGSLAAHALTWLPILDYSAPWAQSVAGADHSPPQSPEEFAAFAAALAARYGPGGDFWRTRRELAADPVTTYEIWNEPDNPGFWTPAPDAAGYDELYLRARDAITAVDPAARVIVGGLSNPGVFLPAMLHARPDLAGHIDGVAIHPYGRTPAIVLARVRGARLTLTELGLASVPLYVTEFGWTVHPGGAIAYAPARLRPRYVTATLATLGHTNCGVAAALLYTWVTPGRDPLAADDWYGIHPPGAGSAADTAAFSAGLQAATAPRAAFSVC